MNLKLFQESNLILERRLSLITRALSFALYLRLSYVMLYVIVLIFQGGYIHVRFL